MSLEKANIVWSAKQLSGMIKNGKINFEHIIQRSYVWERSRKTSLIESAILGYPIPPVFAKRLVDESNKKKGGNIYYIMDGKQRLSTIKEFLNNEFKLTDLPPITYFDADLDKECVIDISGMTFNELPDGLKDHLNTITFSVTYFDNLTKDEERELFKRLNNGKPLSTKARTLASARDIEGLLDIGSHILFEEMLTDKAKANKNQVTLVMKSWVMLNQDVENISFASKDFNPLIEESSIAEEEKIELIRVFDFVAATHTELVERVENKVAKKLYTEVHLISLIPYFKKAMENNINEVMMAEWIIDFFRTNNDSKAHSKYAEASNSGVARNTSIVARHNALNESFEEFFKTEDLNNVLTMA